MNKLFFTFSIIFAFSITVNSQELVSPEPVSAILLKYPNVRDFTISKSPNEAYITIQSPLEEASIIACLKKKEGKWSEPVLANFSGAYKDLEPFLSPDNKRLYFVSNRPLDKSEPETKDFDIWYVERKNISSKWSNPINIGKPINTEFDEFYPSVADNGNMYFTSNSPESKGEDDIFMSTWTKEGYSNPISLDKTINTEGYEFNAFIAPNESFIIFSGYNRNDGLGSGDLYISHKNKDKTWKIAQNLGANINSKYMDYCPFVDLKNNILYFTSKRSAIENREFEHLKDYLNEINKYQNGLSRIYKVESFKVENFD